VTGQITGQTLDRKLVIKGKQHFHSVDAGGYALSVLPTVATPVDLLRARPMFEIGADVDDASRLHWEAQLRTLPLIKGRESVIAMGVDEDEMNRESGDESPIGRREDDRW
jgi:hypothetical protein